MLFGTIGITAAQRYENGCNTVCQSLRQQVRGCFLSQLAYLQIGTTLERRIFYILDLFRKNDFPESGFPSESAVIRLLAECISRHAVGWIDIEPVGVSAAFAGIRADGGIGDVQYLQVLEFIPQVLEVDGIEFSGQCKVGDAVGFVFGEHGH